MTPAASTAAGRRTPVPAPRPPGPRGRAAAPRVPRRVSGPVSGRVAPRPVRRPPASRLSLVGPVVARVRALPENSLIDRLVRGRAWIPLLGVMLAGIVASQVEILKLGSSMGRWIERSSVLSTRNQQLRGTVASLADDQRIESAAAAMGMVMPPATSLGFLSVRSASPASAMAHLHAPDSSRFLATLPSAGRPALTGPTAAAASTVTQGAASPQGAASTSGTAASTSGASTSTGAGGGQANPQVASSASTSSATAASAASPQSSVSAGSASTGSQGTATTSQSASQSSSGAAFPGGAAVAPPTRSSGG